MTTSAVFPPKSKKKKQKLSSGGEEEEEERSPLHTSSNNKQKSWNSLSEDKVAAGTASIGTLQNSSRVFQSNSSLQEKQLMNFIFTRSKLLAAADTSAKGEKKQQLLSAGNTSTSQMSKQYDSFRSAVGLLCKKDGPTTTAAVGSKNKRSVQPVTK